MMKKIIGIAVLLAVLMIIPSLSAAPMLKTVTVKEEPEEVVGISQSEFVINLDDNEEVIWIADSVSRDDDVAYVTEEKTLENIPLFIPGWHLITHTITARNWLGRAICMSMNEIDCGS